MPRLTNADYLDQRHRLMVAGEFRSQLIAELEPYKQHAPHDFFAISHEMYDEDAIAYRQEQTKREPSLPHKAGRAYARFEQILAADCEKRAVVTIETIPMRGVKRPKKVVRVTGLVKPELDVPGLVRMIHRLAIEDQKNSGELLKHRRRRS